MGILSFDLKKLIRAMDGRDIGFMVDEDGRAATDKEARYMLSKYLKEGYDKIPMRTESLPEEKINTPGNKVVDRLKKKLAELQHKRMLHFRKTPMLPVPKYLAAQIAACEDEIKEAEAYEPKRLSEMVSKERLDASGICKAMVKMHVAADYLAECANDLRGKMNSLGFTDCSVFHLTKSIEQQSSRFASIVCHPEFGGLAGYISEDAKLINAIDYIVSKNIDKNLKLT